MKFIERDRNGREQVVLVSWGDHQAGCAKCMEVDPIKSATFANACAQGSPLLMEALVDRQRPVEKDRAERVKAWAKETGAFKTSPGVSKDTLKSITKYK